MAYSIRLLPDHRLALIRLGGEVDGAELLRAMRGVFLDAAWRAGFRVAWDARPLEALRLAADDFAHLTGAARALADQTGPGRSAVLSRGLHDEVAAQLLNLRRRGHPEREVRAFMDPREAAAWLGLPADALERAG